MKHFILVLILATILGICQASANDYDIASMPLEELTQLVNQAGQELLTRTNKTYLIISQSNNLHIPENHSISNDPHKAYIPDYIGKNLASIGKLYEAGLRINLGPARNGVLDIEYISTDGSYIDLSDKDSRKNYMIIGQYPEPNTEVIYSYRTIGSKEQIDGLALSQTVKSITFIVTPIK